MSMNIVHLVPTEIPINSEFGGAVQKRALALISEQNTLGHLAIALSPGRTAMHQETDQSIRIINLHLPRPWRDFEYMFKARRFIRKSGIKFDVVHSHGLPLVSLFTPSGITTILTVDYFRYKYSETKLGWLIYRFALIGFTKVVCVSKYCQREFSSFFKISDAIVIYNGVDLNVNETVPQYSEAVLYRYGLQDQEFVLYLGRICEQKGSKLLPLIAQHLKELSSGLRLVAAGPDSHFGNDSSDFSRFEHAEVTYLGSIHDDEVPILLAKAKALVLPTIRDEMFGMVIPEALAQGTPVVASNLGGIPEALGGGGILFEVGDYVACTNAIELVSAEGRLREEVIASGRKHITRFQWPLISDAYILIYQGVTSA